MAPANKDKSKSSSVSYTSPKKAARKAIGKVLQYSPREKAPRINKVFVVGTQLGIILLRTEKQNSKDDAYTNDVMVMIEDETSGVASKLQIIKISSRRQSQEIDQAILQSTVYPSKWYVSITDETNNTAEYRKEHAERFIAFLNKAQWKYPQLFIFAGDETKVDKDKIVSTLDEYLLNQDIASILKTFVFEDFESFLEDEEAINQVFGGKPTANQARNWLVDGWIKNGANI